MADTMEKVRAAIEQELFVNKYTVDAHEPHIRVKDMEVCGRCATRPCTIICPAAVFVWEQQQLTVQYSGCLECGSCRLSCPHDNLEWRYPRGGFGVVLKVG